MACGGEVKVHIVLPLNFYEERSEWKRERERDEEGGGGDGRKKENFTFKPSDNFSRGIFVITTQANDTRRAPAT